MKRGLIIAQVVLLPLFGLYRTAAQRPGKGATVHLRIVNVSNGRDLGMPTIQTFEREYGDLPSSNLADLFRGNVASRVPYDFYKLCARATGFWTNCTEVPVYQPQVWVALGLRVGITGLAGLSGLRGTVENIPPGETSTWVRLMGLYSGIAIDAKLDSSGRFFMSGIPPGSWVLVTIGDQQILDTRSVHVPTSGTLEIDLQLRK